MSDYDPPAEALRRVAALALAEDLGVLGDITSLACIDRGTTGRASFVARAAGVLAGTAAATEVLRQVDTDLVVEWRRGDGEAVAPGDRLGTVRGPLRSILAGERVALNLLTHCSGVATITRRFVDAAAPARVLDTRKTIPGLRALQRAAVRAGGGLNHRDSLSDAVLVKDNHVAAVGITAAVRRARERWPGRLVEVECDRSNQVEEARDAGADRVLLDNMTPAEVAAVVEVLGGRLPVEVSGGVTIDDVAAYAAAGADFVSVGAITHSVHTLDIALDLDATERSDRGA
jgi:nicotinate-nucleotide pyrophosphorylase (carboxylating)